MPQIINGVTCRTREESLKHILSQAEKGKIGPNLRKGDTGCRYRYGSGNNCAVGSLFSPAQLDHIERLEANSNCLLGLWSHIEIGIANIEAVTGLSVKDLTDIQSAHDATLTRTARPERAVAAVVNLVETMLENPPAKV